MITRSPIVFEDFLSSSIAPQVMPPWLTEFAMSLNDYGFDVSSQVLMTFSSQRSPGGSEPWQRQRSQDDSGNYGQVWHSHRESSEHNWKNQDLISNIQQVP